MNKYLDSNYSNNNYSSSNNSNSNHSNSNFARESGATGKSINRQSSPYLSSELATPQTRIIAFILDAVLMGALLGVGWFIWFLMIAGRGTTPAHDLMGQVIIDVKTGKPASFGKVFIRECLVKGLLSMVLASMTMFINYIVDGAFLLRDDRRTVHDHLLGTKVVQSHRTALLDKLQSL